MTPINDTTHKELTTILRDEVYKTLPKFHVELSGHHLFEAYKCIHVYISLTNHLINNVAGQYPQKVCFSLSVIPTLKEVSNIWEMEFRIDGVWNRIDRIPDPNHPKERYLAIAGEKFVFPVPNKVLSLPELLRQLTKFCARYKQALADNRVKLHGLNLHFTKDQLDEILR